MVFVCINIKRTFPMSNVKLKPLFKIEEDLSWPPFNTLGKNTIMPRKIQNLCQKIIDLYGNIILDINADFNIIKNEKNENHLTCMFSINWSEDINSNIVENINIPALNELNKNVDKIINAIPYQHDINNDELNIYIKYNISRDGFEFSLTDENDFVPKCVNAYYTNDKWNYTETVQVPDVLKDKNDTNNQIKKEFDYRSINNVKSYNYLKDANLLILNYGPGQFNKS